MQKGHKRTHTRSLQSQKHLGSLEVFYRPIHICFPLTIYYWLYYYMYNHILRQVLFYIICDFWDLRPGDLGGIKDNPVQEGNYT